MTEITPSAESPRVARSVASRPAMLSVIVFLGAVLFVACWLGFRTGFVIVPPRELTGLEPDVAKAINEAQRVVLRRPQAGAAWGYLGMVLYAHELTADAVTCLQKAESFDATDFRWPYLLGVILESSDRTAAKSAFLRATVRAPTSLLPQARLADLCFGSGDLEEAEAHLLNAEKIDAHDARVHLRKAQCLLQRGQFQDCIAAAEIARKLAPSARGPLEVQATAKSRLGEKDAAAELLNAIRQLPNQPDRWPDAVIQAANEMRRDVHWRQFLAKDALDQGNWSAAVEIIEPLWQRDPNNESLSEQLAMTWLAAREFGRAEIVLKRALESNREATRLLRILGTLHLLREEWNDAVIAFEKVLQASPNDSGIHSDLSFCFQQLGKNSEAISHARTAVSLMPDTSSFLIRLIEALAHDHQQTEAARCVEQLRKISHDNLAIQRVESLLTEKP